MIPSIGRIVHYQLTQQDADEINRRRTTSSSIAERIKNTLWPLGAQAHIGNSVHAGDIVAAIIVNWWGDECINAQAFLDGNDTFWLTSRNFGTDEDGKWAWPPRV